MQYFARLTPELKYLVGAEFSQETARSPRYFTADDRYRENDAQLFGDLDWSPWANVSFNLGGNLEYSSYTGTLFSPRLAMNYRVDEQSALRMSAGQAYRRPSIFEAQANESLIADGKVLRTGIRSLGHVDAERVRHIDASYLLQIAEWKLDLDVRAFIEKYDQFIDNERCYFPTANNPGLACPFPPPVTFPPPGSSVDFLINQGQVSMKGIEGRFDWRQPWGRVLGSLTLVNIFDIQDFKEPDLIKSAPEAQGYVMLIKYLPDRWRFSLSYYYQGSMMWLNDGDYLKPRNLWNAKLSRTFGKPGAEGEFAITAMSLAGDYPEFNQAIFRQESMLFATLRLGF